MSTELSGLFRALAERGDAPALIAIGRQGARTLSGETLLGRINAEATRLRHGAETEEAARIAVFAGPSPEAAIAMLAVLRSGAVLVPIDAQATDATLEGILEDAAPAAVYCDEPREAQLANVRPSLRRITVADVGNPVEKISEFPVPPPEQTATLFYTSGTTGPPKGVPLSWANLAYQVRVLDRAGIIRRDDRVLLPLPLHHVYPVVIGLFAPLTLGLPVILPTSLTGSEVLRALRDGEATVMIGVPRLYRALLEGLERRGGIAFTWLDRGCTLLRARLRLQPGRLLLPLHRRIGPHLRLLASGGAQLPAALALRLEGLGWAVAVGYGLTETSPLLTLNLPLSPHPDSVGRAVPDTDLRVRDGELQARGPGVFAGYRHLPERSAEAFTEDGWYRTGDLARIGSDGFVYITGRAATLLVTEGGKNVQPDEVEAAFEAQPAIAEIAVLQEKDGRLVALAVADQGIVRKQEKTAEAVVNDAVGEVSQRLPSYQRPAEIAVTERPLPRTRLGKLRRHLLEERYRQARAGREPAAAGPMPLEEMTDADRALLEDEAAHTVWELLAERYPQRRLTPDTSPQLELGIDSMEWLDLGLEIGRRTGVEVDDTQAARIEHVRDLLQTVSELKAGGGTGANKAPALGGDAERWLRPLPPAGAAVARSLFHLNRILVRRGFDLSVSGRPPATGQVIFTPNHLSYLDPFVLAAALDWPRMRRTFWAGWTGAAFRNPVLRALSRLAQAVPVDAGSARTSLALAGGVLERGFDLVWFPEGARSPHGRLQPFKAGIGRLLAEYPTTVVPVIIRGTYEALPPERRLPSRHPVSLHFGAAVEPDELAADADGDEPSERLRRGLQGRMEALLGAA